MKKPAKKNKASKKATAKAPAKTLEKTKAAAKKRPIKETWVDWLHDPEYPYPYGPISGDSVKEVLKRIHAGLEKNSPAYVVDKKTGRKITDFSKPNPDADVAQGAFRIISYEWGVVHTGMMQCSTQTGDKRFNDYTSSRLQFMVDALPYFKSFLTERPRGVWKPAFITTIHPRSLDDTGSLCAAMIKAHRANLATGLLPIIEHYMDFIMNKQYRLSDGTFARKRPVINSLWLDDMYMSVPAISQMYKLTGDTKYLDEALRQVRQFVPRLFNEQKGLYSHGWYESSDQHPAFRWARANGWAMLAKIELLEVLPEDHPERPFVLEQYRKHAFAVAALQSGQGFWHQLIDRNETYLETSATAIFTYCLARGINRGWLDKLAYGPVVLNGWGALTTRVNAKGQVEGTCIGSGMAMDPVFYTHRPQSALAAHGYGPTLLAGSEILPLVESGCITMHDGTVQCGPSMDMS